MRCEHIHCDKVIVNKITYTMTDGEEHCFCSIACFDAELRCAEEWAYRIQYSGAIRPDLYPAIH